MILREVEAKTVLSKSKVAEYTVNPYVGCEHGCTYCYARFMKRYTGHREPWGQFVDVKVNAAELLTNEVSKKQPGRVWVSGVCDPYQPVEQKYTLTRRCLNVLAHHGWPVTIQTKSPLVSRDIPLFKTMGEVEVGLSITTADEEIRRAFEPYAPSIADRIEALNKLHSTGIRTYCMIAPLLPNARGLAGLLKGKADYVLVDRMNYHHADWVYREHGLEHALTSEYFAKKKLELAKALRKENIPCELLF